MVRKLYRDSYHKMIAGVCSGIADYFQIDPTIVRLLFVLFCLCGGAGVLAYIICMLVIPVRNDLVQ